MSDSTSATFQSVSACKTFVENKQDRESRVIWNFTLRVVDLPKTFQLDPNARLADPKRPTVKKMLDTLGQSPEDFIFFNNGILIIANSVSVKGRKDGSGFDVELSLLSPNEEEDEDFIGNGIVNGGHTYLAVKKAIDAYERLSSKITKSKKVRGVSSSGDFQRLDEAYIQISVMSNVREDDIPKISRYRNTSEKVEEFSLKNLANEWDTIQENLPEDYLNRIAFKDGEGKPFDVTDIVRRLACINGEIFPWQDQKHPIATCSAYGHLIKNWKKINFQSVVHLTEDALYLEDLIREEFDCQSGISKFKCIKKKSFQSITGKEFEHHIPITFIFPILAAFRVFIRNGQWVKPVDELWQDVGKKLVYEHLDRYRKEGRGNPAAFGRSNSTWTSLLMVPLLSLNSQG
jgi:AIPR protein